MSDVRVASGFERLPWLADETQVRTPRRRRAMSPLWLAGALAVLILIAGAAYWLGTRSGPVDELTSAGSEPNRPPVTVPLPAPVAMPPMPTVKVDPVPQVEPVALPPAPVIREATQRPTRKLSRTKAHAVARAKSGTSRRAKPIKRKVAPAKRASALPIWPVRAETHSAGRLVRVGTFATTRDAKRGWTKIMRFYPGMKRLPAMAVPITAVPSGRKFYRLQMGTTSQAHSEVLCQRMRIIGVSCVVLDIGTTRR
jgi:hypothetical protein